MKKIQEFFKAKYIIMKIWFVSLFAYVGACLIDAFFDTDIWLVPFCIFVGLSIIVIVCLVAEIILTDIYG